MSLEDTVKHLVILVQWGLNAHLFPHLHGHGVETLRGTRRAIAKEKKSDVMTEREKVSFSVVLA